MLAHLLNITLLVSFFHCIHKPSKLSSSFRSSSLSFISMETRYRLEARGLTCKLISNTFQERVFSCFSKSSCKYILQDVSCEALPGEITAIAGPSGAGKTTLLEILAGKVRPRAVSGHVMLNNMPMDCKRFQRLSGYVTQEDALFPFLTVQETLMYSAFLRLRIGKHEALIKVKKLMNELGLDHVASSRIGEGLNDGISGGERRRVSIGVELVHDPGVLLIDEPTSGLDSASAMHVISLLKSMAVRQCKTVVLTIHQPGFRILELLDRLVLLSNGLVVHNGSLELLEERLRVAGHGIPKHVNVLEFAIDIFSDTLVVQSQTLANQRTNLSLSLTFPIIKMEGEKPIRYANSRIGEVMILGKRFCCNVFRTRQLLSTRVIQALAAGFILGTVFLKTGNDLGPTGLQTRIGFFAFSLTFLLSSTTEGLPIFLQERRILMRETSRGAYRVSSYVLANTLVFIPFLLVIGFLFTTPVYWLVGLRKDFDGFLYYSMIVWLVLLMSNSFVACFSALVPNFIMGNSVISGFMGSFFLFSGYFIAEKNIPKYWIFMHYLSLFKYPFECFMINEYGGEQGRVRCIQVDEQGRCGLFGDGFLARQELVESQKWSNLGVMLAFIIGYRVISFLILWLRCYKFRT